MVIFYVAVAVAATIAVARAIFLFCTDPGDRIRGRLRLARGRIAACFALAAALVGCSTPSPIAPYGAGSSFVWKDATGAVVPVYGDPGEPIYLAGGLIWGIDPNTAVVGVGFASGVFGTWPAFETTDCTGAKYLLGGTTPAAFPDPDITFADPFSTAILARPDDEKSVTVHRCSSLTAGGCVQIAGGCDMFEGLDLGPLTPTPALTIPVVDFAAPLHPEVAK